MNRKTALVTLRFAGYHSDSSLWTRTYIENRVSRAKANEEWARGASMKVAGIPCTCLDCRSHQPTENRA